MRKKERLERGVRQVQLLLPEDQHRRLKVHAALNGMTIGEVLISRLIDIIDPMGAEDARAMAEPN